MWSSSADFSCLAVIAFTAKISFFLWRGCLIPSSWKWKMKTDVKSRRAAWPSEDAVSRWRYSTWVEHGSRPLPSALGSTWSDRENLALLCQLSCGWAWVGSGGVGGLTSLCAGLGRDGSLLAQGSALTFSMSWGVAVSNVWPEVTHCLAKITYWARPKSSSHAHTRSVLHWAKGPLASLGSRKQHDPVIGRAWAPAEHNSASQKGTRFKQKPPSWDPVEQNPTTMHSSEVDSRVSRDNPWSESQVCSCRELGAVICSSGSCAHVCYQSTCTRAKAHLDEDPHLNHVLHRA